jgi:hypothetical protein
MNSPSALNFILDIGKFLSTSMLSLSWEIEHLLFDPLGDDNSEEI